MEIEPTHDYSDFLVSPLLEILFWNKRNAWKCSPAFPVGIRVLFLNASSCYFFFCMRIICSVVSESAKQNFPEDNTWPATKDTKRTERNALLIASKISANLNFFRLCTYSIDTVMPEVER